MLVGWLFGRKKCLATTPCACSFGSRIPTVSALFGIQKSVFFNVFLLSDSQKTTVFIVSIASLGVYLFDSVFLYFWRNLKNASSGRTQNIEKSIGFISIFSLGPGLCSHFWLIAEKYFFIHHFYVILKKHKFLLSQMHLWVSRFFC